jgi:integrase
MSTSSAFFDAAKSSTLKSCSPSGIDLMSELRKLWKATQQMGHPFGTLIRLILVTGTRKSEALHAQRREFDLDEGLWEIPAQRFKSNRKHLVPLSPLALDIKRRISSCMICDEQCAHD